MPESPSESYIKYCIEKTQNENLVYNMVPCAVEILVVGAGGTGVECLKNIASFTNICKVFVVDFDDISETNLNRQFFYREEDVGKNKAIVCCERLNELRRDYCLSNLDNRINGDVKDKFTESTFPIEKDCFIPINSDIQTSYPLPINFKNITICLSCVDNIEARRYLNQRIYQVYQSYNHCIPLIDGGSEGWMGHCRLYIPGYSYELNDSISHISGCLECSLNLYNTSDQGLPICSIRSNPRRPEHCVEIVYSEIENPEIIDWKLFVEKVIILCIKHNIPFIRDSYDNHREFSQSPSLNELLLKNTDEKFIEKGGEILINIPYCRGIVERIVPAIPTTNSIVGGLMSLTVFKLLYDEESLNFIYFFDSSEGGQICLEKYPLAKNEDCVVCAENNAM